jgi:hydrogenase maturation protease
MSFELAQKIADAVLYEGYVLYPYRASAAKNRIRWQFGVVVPRAYAELGGSEPWAMRTECLVEAGDARGVELDLRVRFLQVQARFIEEKIVEERIVEERLDGGAFRPVETLAVGDRTLVTWEEGVERRLDAVAIPLAELLAGEREIPVEMPAGREIELVHGEDGDVAARVVRERWSVSGVIRVAAEPADGLVRVRVRIENLGTYEGTDREGALRRSLVGAHTLLAVRGGAFVSLLDPSPAHAAAAAACANEHTWPVLAGPEGSRDVLLSSPIILYDHPAVAAESTGDFCDATEIDEILTLRVMTLTDEEKREARGTDERSRQIIERSDSIPPELFERMHGAIRSLGPTAVSPPVSEDAARTRATLAELSEWETFLNPPGVVPPEEATIEVMGTLLGRGSRVRLRPSRSADSMDFFLAGREARVEGVYRDVEDVAWVAVSLEGDPASDLHSSHGRFFYFYPEEIEPLESHADSERKSYETSDPGRTGAGGGGDLHSPAAGSAPVPENRADVELLSPHTLVACVGNIFLGDDGFGVEVARRLAAREIPEGVRIADFGIRGVHLAYELADKSYPTVILVDATPRGGEPGTVYLIEPDLDRLGEQAPGAADAHGMDPQTVFALLRTLGGKPGRVLIVGCEPASTEEEIALSEPVAAAVDEAVKLILELVERGDPAAAEPV